jgi:hypothetical protein
MKQMSISPQRRRSFRTYRARGIGTMAAVVLFGMLSVPVVNAESSFSSGTASASASSSSVEAVPTPAGTPSSVDPAKAKISEEQAVAKVRELFPAFKDAQMSSAELTTNSGMGDAENSDPVWRIQWSFQRGNTSYGFSSEVNAVTGDLLQVGFPYNLFPETSYYPPKVKKEQAKALAYEFVGKAVPSLKGQKLQDDNLDKGMLLSPLFGPVIYSFSFQSLHEGIKIQGQSIRVSVSGDGSIRDFYFYNRSLEYPSSKPKVTLENAAVQWQKDVQVQLAYVPEDYYGYNRVPNSWKLAYVQALPLNVLDAQTGQWLDMENKPADLSKAAAYTALPAPPQPFKPGPVTAEEAIKSVASYAEIPEGYTVNSKQLSKGMNGEPDTWQLRWGRDNNGFGPDGLYAQVNAQTGQLFSINMDLWGPRNNPQQEAPKIAPMARDKAVKIADDWILAHIPGAAGYKRLESSVSPAYADTGYSTVTYQLFYRDVMVQGRAVTITLNAQGRMVGFYGGGELGPTEKLDQLKPEITAEQAKQKILQATEMELIYVRSGGFNIAPSGRYIPVTMTLAYVPTDREDGNTFYRYVDAVSGKLISPYASPAAGALSDAVDIQPHWAAESLQASVEHGVLIPDEAGKVHPDNTLTTGEFLRMVSLALNPFNEQQNYYRGGVEKPFADIDPKSPYYNAVNVWIGQGWLVQDSGVKLLPEQLLTRDRMAVYLSKMSGYEKLSSRLGKDDLLSRLKDAKSIPHPGAAVLAMKLGLMSPVSSKFMPEGKITVAEAATVLLRFAQLQGELDRPLQR